MRALSWFYAPKALTHAFPVVRCDGRSRTPSQTRGSSTALIISSASCNELMDSPEQAFFSGFPESGPLAFPCLDKSRLGQRRHFALKRCWLPNAIPPCRALALLDIRISKLFLCKTGVSSSAALSCFSPMTEIPRTWSSSGVAVLSRSQLPSTRRHIPQCLVVGVFALAYEIVLPPNTVCN
jgi:hypothetical protein